MVKRFRIEFEGYVQGVGFRPTIFRLANELNLSGFVKNSPLGVILELEGEEKRINEFILRLPEKLPKIAKIKNFKMEEIEVKNENVFKILSSDEGKRQKAISTPDIIVCDECKRELNDINNRRFRYPFTNCTICGPRFTIIYSFPYDRKRTSMACFDMCKDCKEEYENPLTRRFHAEATCCPECGPRVVLLNGDGSHLSDGEEAIEKTKYLLKEGKIVAIKGLGGFQLAVDANNLNAVKELRKRKRRESKPFAVMVKDLDVALRYCYISQKDKDVLTSEKGPILLLRKRIDFNEEISPLLNDIGLFLPTTPLHLELFRDAPYESLIMTSGNKSDEPIAISNREALTRLKGIADYFLVHNRDILRRIDDSVLRSDGEETFIIRRARGYVPESIKVNFESENIVVGLGAFLQNTCCILKYDEAFMTPHIGDLDSLEARKFFDECLESFKNFLEVDYDTVVTDLHPDYFSTLYGERMAKEKGTNLIKVQHHLAHLCSVLEENKAFPEKNDIAYGIVLDGTGLGNDGTLWGGEFFQIDGNLEFKRVSHLKEFPLLGGEKAVKEPIRVAIALLRMEEEEELLKKFFDLEVILNLKLEGWPLSSGAGRLFEAAGSLCGLTLKNRYEGEAAMAFEAFASRYDGKAEVWREVDIESDNIFPTSKFFKAFAYRLKKEQSKEKVAFEFHYNFARLCSEIAKRVFEKGKVVGLSGGCFNNRLLRKFFKIELSRCCFFPLLNYNIPSGDGGISFGQVVYGGRLLSRR